MQGKAETTSPYSERTDDQTLVDIHGQLASQAANELSEAVSATQRRSKNSEQVQCCCGKTCKGMRGLKAH